MLGADRSHDLSAELLERLRESEQPLERRRLPAASIRVRLETSPAIRHVIPARLAVATATLRAERAWRSSEKVRTRATRAMEAILAGTPRAGEADQLAPQMVIRTAVRESLLWHPWRPPLLDEESERNLRLAAGSGRGLMVSNCHQGPHNMAISVYRRVDRIPHIVAAPWMFEIPTGHWGRRTVRWWEGARKGGARLVKTTAGAFATTKALLERAELVLIPFDMPGSRTTHFLGKPVDLASGTALLAAATDSLVLPARVLWDGTRTRVLYGSVLDPRDFADAEELHEALAARHEASILEEPEEMEDPRRPGAWEEHAGPQRWARPPRD